LDSMTRLLLVYLSISWRKALIFPSTQYCRKTT